MTGGVDTATLSLRVDGRQAQTEAQRTEQSLGRLGKTGMSVQKAMYALGVTMSAGLLFRKLITNTIAAQDSLVQLEARLVSTGGAAGKTMNELTALADELQKVTKYGDETTESAIALLLTFKKIKGDTFDQATRATLDLATALGSDLKSAALQVGKALEDPSTQMSQLRRSGVSFTQEQIEMAKQLQATGDIAGAQAIVLKELQSQFGGAATAARTTLGGALAYLSNQWGDLFEASSEATAGIVAAINSLGDALPYLGKAFGAVFGVINRVAANAAVMWEDAKLKWLQFKSLFVFGEAQQRLNREIDAQRRALEFMKEAAADAGEEGNALGKTFRTLTTDLEGLGGAVDDVLTPWEDFLAILQEIRAEAEALKRADLKDALQFGMGGVIPGQGTTVPTLGTDAVSMRLDLPVREVEEFNRSLGDLGRYLLDNADVLVGAARGALALADALGNLSQGARQAVQGVLNIAEGIKAFRDAQKAEGAMATLGQIGGIVGIASGIVSVVQGIRSASEQAEEAAYQFRRSVQNWEQALDEFGRMFSTEDPLTKMLKDTATNVQALWDDLRDVYAGKGLRIDMADMPSLAYIEETLAGLKAFQASLPTFAAKAMQPMVDFWEKARALALESGDVAERAREIHRKTIEAATEELAVRRLLATGMDKEAATLRKQIEQRKELEAATAAGWDEATIAILREVLALEWDAFVASLEEVADAVEDLDTAFLRNLDVRELYARGLDSEALALQRDIEAQELLERGYDEATVARLQYIYGLEDEAAALAAAEAARRQAASFEGDLQIRETALSGSDLEALTTRLQVQGAAELERARELLGAGENAEELLARLAAVIEGETARALDAFVQSAEEAAAAATEAAEAEAFRASQDMANLSVRLLQAQGLSEEAAVMRAQIELMQALNEGRSAEYIALLEQIHAEEARARAMAKSTQAVNETAQAANDLARVLNAPSGLRLSLLQWRASAFDRGGIPGLGASGSASTSTFNFGKESITVVAAKGESGEALLDRILEAANRRATGGAGNVFTSLPEAN